MKRRTLLSGLMAAPALPLLTANAQAADAFHESTVQALDLSPDYWRDKVSEAAWKVLFEEDTERPGSSPLDKLYDNGTYVCAACHRKPAWACVGGERALLPCERFHSGQCLLPSATCVLTAARVRTRALWGTEASSSASLSFP